MYYLQRRRGFFGPNGVGRGYFVEHGSQLRRLQREEERNGGLFAEHRQFNVFQLVLQLVVHPVVVIVRKQYQETADAFRQQLLDYGAVELFQFGGDTTPRHGAGSRQSRGKRTSLEVEDGRPTAISWRESESVNVII